jgi:capsular polysaccharide transport system permease protein
MKALAVTQARVIGALVLRETRTRFGRNQLGYLWALAEPITYVALLSIIFGALSRHAPFGNDIGLFFATGILPYLYFTGLTKSLGAAFEANEALLSYPIVKETDTLFARAALETATSVMVIVLTLGGMIVLVKGPAPDRVHVMAGAIIGLGLAGFGVGTINAAIGRLVRSWKQTYDLVTRPLIVLSAVFYPLESLPADLRSILSWLPTVQGVEWFRSGYYEGYRCSDLAPDYLIISGLVLAVTGLALERVLRIPPQ